MTIRADISRQDFSHENERLSDDKTAQRPKGLPVRKLYREERRKQIFYRKKV